MMKVCVVFLLYVILGCCKLLCDCFSVAIDVCVNVLLLMYCCYCIVVIVLLLLLLMYC